MHTEGRGLKEVTVEQEAEVLPHMHAVMVVVKHRKMRAGGERW